MLDTCDLTVAAPMNISSAISALLDLWRGQHHLALPVGQAPKATRNGRVHCEAIRELPDQATGDRRREQCPAFSDGPHGDGKLLWRDVLEDEATRSRSQRLVDVFVGIERGEDEHAHVPVRLGEDARGRLEPVHLRHPDVHEDHVRPMGPCCVDRLETRPCLGHHLDVVVDTQNHGETAPNQCLVVDDEDADAHPGSPPPGR